MTHTLADSSLDSGSSPSGKSQAELATEAVRLVRHWLTEGAKVPVDASARQLAGVLKDPNGLEQIVLRDIRLAHRAG